MKRFRSSGDNSILAPPVSFPSSAFDDDDDVDAKNAMTYEIKRILSDMNNAKHLK